MRKLVVLFFVTMLIQNISAQDDIIYVDEEGRIIDKWDIERPKDISRKKKTAEFKVAKPMRRTPKQIVVRTISGRHIKSSSALETGKNYYLFEVAESEDTSLIGKPVICQIIERRKSNVTGVEGRLILRPLYIEKDSLQIPVVPTDIHRRGLNRSSVKFWLLIPSFVAGSKAEILPEERIVLSLE